MLNFMSYMAGLVTYVLLLPAFMNMFQLYSMSNLHDLSWGSRPGGVQINVKQQMNYMQYRIYFIIFWLLANIAYVMIFTNLLSFNKIPKPGSGDINILEIVGMYYGVMNLFRFVFGLCTICEFHGRKWGLFGKSLGHDA